MLLVAFKILFVLVVWMFRNPNVKLEPFGQYSTDKFVSK